MNEELQEIVKKYAKNNKNYMDSVCFNQHITRLIRVKCQCGFDLKIFQDHSLSKDPYFQIISEECTNCISNALKNSNK